MKFEVDDIIVTSDDKEATEKQAKLIASIFVKNWLENHPQGKPMYITILSNQGAEVTYTVKAATKH